MTGATLFNRDGVAVRTYGAIERMRNGWRITDLEPHVRIRLKAIFPRIPKTGVPPFELVGGPQLDADLRWFIERYPLLIAADDLGHLEQRKTLFETGQAELETLLAKDWKPSSIVGFRDGERPYDYQAQAAELCRRKGRLLCTDDMGLGKTVTGIATITDPQQLPALIVPPTHLVSQWAEKLNEFTHLSVHAFKKASPYELPPADVYICPYSKLAGWIDYAESAGFQALIFDEIQELRNGTHTAKGQAAAAFKANAKTVLGLSGTPIYNYGSEIWHVMQFIDPDALGSWLDFTIEWCEMGPGKKWIVKDPQALGTYLREEHAMLGRTNEDVGNEKKRINTITHEIAYDAEVLEEDEQLMRDLAIKVTAGTFTERGQAAREFDMRMRHATGVAKAPHVAAFVRILLEAGEQVVLAGWHRDVYDIWLNRLARFNPVLYTGTESPGQKEKSKRAFLSGEARIIILSLRSGAGLDGLQHVAHTAVIGELDWSPKVHDQFIARLARPGQINEVDAIYLVSDGGSDPAILDVCGLKASQSDGIVNPLAMPADQKSDRTRIQALAEAYLAGKGSALKPAASRPLPAMELGPRQLELIGGGA